MFEDLDRHPRATTGKEKQLFPLGHIVITRGALQTVNPDDVQRSIARHAKGDWGDLEPQDRAENELSLRQGFRLLSTYADRSGTKFYIITEADRSVTTILLPSEY
jgi:hypothetical protein